MEAYVQGDWFSVTDGFGTNYLCVLTQLGGKKFALVTSKGRMFSFSVEVEDPEHISHEEVKKMCSGPDISAMFRKISVDIKVKRFE